MSGKDSEYANRGEEEKKRRDVLERERGMMTEEKR